MSALTEILFRLFAWVRPLLWYYHRIGHVLEAALISLERPSVIARLVNDPARRSQWAAIILDLEFGLDLAIGLRTRELLGQRIDPEARPGLRHKHLIRIYRAPGFEPLLQRLARLIERYCHLERLARLRADRIRREIDAAPVLLAADHRPQQHQPAFMMIALSPLSPATSYAFLAATAGRRIRAPP
jgi:hypothetical protein